MNTPFHNYIQNKNGFFVLASIRYINLYDRLLKSSGENGKVMVTPTPSVWQASYSVEQKDKIKEFVKGVESVVFVGHRICDGYLDRWFGDEVINDDHLYFAANLAKSYNKELIIAYEDDFCFKGICPVKDSLQGEFSNLEKKLFKLK